MAQSYSDIGMCQARGNQAVLVEETISLYANQIQVLALRNADLDVNNQPLQAQPGVGLPLRIGDAENARTTPPVLRPRDQPDQPV
jgi:hypothetical protein